MDVFQGASEGMRPHSAKQAEILFVASSFLYRLQIQRPLNYTIRKGRARKLHGLSELWAEEKKIKENKRTSSRVYEGDGKKLMLTSTPEVSVPVIR